jgi:hypothetical protein
MALEIQAKTQAKYLTHPDSPVSPAIKKTPWRLVAKLNSPQVDKGITLPFKFRSMDGNKRYWTDPERVA